MDMRGMVKEFFVPVAFIYVYLKNYWKPFT